MTKNYNRDKDEESSRQTGGCPTPNGSCGMAGQGGMKDRRPEMSETKCLAVNDVGMLYDQNSSAGVPYIIGPNQRRLFDFVHIVQPTLPADRNYQFSLAMRDLFTKMREPSNGVVPPYTEEDMMCWLLNARSRRIVLQHIIRIARYVNMRLAKSLNWSRGLAAALGLPVAAALNAVGDLHDAAVTFTEDYADLMTHIKRTANLVGQNDYLFGVAIIKDDDEMFEECFVDDCQTPTIHAFFCPIVPKYVVDGHKVKQDGYYDLATMQGLTSAADMIQEMDDILTTVDGAIMGERSPARSALIIDLNNYMNRNKLNLGGVCLPKAAEVTDGENAPARVDKIPIMPDKWVQRIRNAFGLHLISKYSASGHHCTSYLSESSIDMSTGEVVNKVVENLGISESHSYPVFTMKGFSISSDEDCGRNKSDRTYFISVGTFKDELISGAGVNTRTVTLQETRGWVYLDAVPTWDSDNAFNRVCRGSGQSFTMVDHLIRSVIAMYDEMAAYASTHIMPPLIRGAADGSDINHGSNTMAQKFRTLEWITARLVRVYHAAAAEELWLSIAMFPHTICTNTSEASVAQSVTKP